MVISGYKRALVLAENELMNREPEVIANNAGVAWTGKTFELPWFGRFVSYDQGSIEERILWAHYMLAQGPRRARNIYITYKQVPGAAIYNANFVKRCIDPMVKKHKSDLSAFFDAGVRLGGRRVDLGHMAFTLDALPYIPITFVIWQGDEEVRPSGNILFDEGVIEWLCPEDIVVLASLSVRELIKDTLMTPGG